MKSQISRKGETRIASILRRLALVATLCMAAGAWAGAEKRPAGVDGSRKNLLTSKYDQKFLLEHLTPRKNWAMFPAAKDRAAWDTLQAHALNQARKAYLTGQAEALLKQPWPALPATLYMEYVRTGNRSHYQAPYFQRRAQLGALVLAECMQYRGRFLDEIANGIWAICEESTWCIPAHGSYVGDDVLHRLDVESLDLFACETGMLLAQTHYLLEKELDALSPTLCERIRREVRRRILDPYAAGDNFGRSGWIHGGNNWSPWCASNVMGAAMYLEDDPQRLAAMVWRLMQVVDRFINNYGEDGGCDEGPSYWGEAGGAMLVFLELLHSRTNGAIDIYADPKIAAIGRFITHAHINGPWFVNFSDADPQGEPSRGKVYRFGDRIGSEAMKNLALASMREWNLEGPVHPPIQLGRIRPILGPLMELFWIPPDAKPSKMVKELDVWLPDVQMLFARETTAPDKGLFLAAKGGHNAESHNHNDSGHFIVYLDGQPAIIDIGREEYTRQTFSNRRYELLFTRGLGHNAPVVGGIEQAAGREYEATDVQFASKEFGPYLAMNLEKAYPAKSGLRSLRREFELHRGARPRVRVRDSFESGGEPLQLQVNFYAARPTKLDAPGRISIACTPRPLVMEYDAAMLSAKVEAVPLTDENLREGWGDQIWHIVFDLKKPAAAGTYQFEFTAAN
ncbi:MAG: heparinase II/III-family protein [Candidatus Sumerlaeia bacterium]|nr:heparinase II/III-family protein [Candidatus Sumerlaeia bacterium]